MRSRFGVSIGPPNVLGLPKPASSISTTNTFGAPCGGAAWPISPQSGSEPASVLAVTPVNAGRRMGSLVRSGVSGMGSVLSGDRGRRRLYALSEATRERATLFDLCVGEVGPRNRHPKEAPAVLTAAEVADEREQ